MELKELLSNYISPEKIEEAIEKINQELPKDFIPKSRFNEVNEKLKLTSSALEEKNKTYEDLKQKSGSLEEYQSKVADLEKKNKEIEDRMNKEISSMVKKTKFKDLLAKSGASVDAMDLIIEKYADGVEVENDTIKGAEDLIKKIKEERKTLFVEVGTESNAKGGNGKTGGDDDVARLKKLFGL